MAMSASAVMTGAMMRKETDLLVIHAMMPEIERIAVVHAKGT